MGFHAPQEAARILGESIDYGRQAQLSVEKLRLEAAAKPAAGKGDGEVDSPGFAESVDSRGGAPETRGGRARVGGAQRGSDPRDGVADPRGRGRPGRSARRGVWSGRSVPAAACRRSPRTPGWISSGTRDFPTRPRATFRSGDLNQRLPVEDGAADVVVSIETIEHLENPRALFRELVRAVRPGGLLLVTTPNQLSLLSKLSFVVKDRHGAFQAVHYPAHITALPPVGFVEHRRGAEAGPGTHRLLGRWSDARERRATGRPDLKGSALQRQRRVRRAQALTRCQRPCFIRCSTWTASSSESSEPASLLDWRSGGSRLRGVECVAVSTRTGRVTPTAPTIARIARRRSAASPSERFTAAARSFARRRPRDRRRWS